MPVVTVYLHPTRYTCDMMRDGDAFTVSFFPASCRKALGYMGSHSGRDCDKVAGSGLTPKRFGPGVGYEEAELTLLCRKLYQHQFSKADIAEDVRYYYAENPRLYPPDASGEWQPHWTFIGEIVGVEDRR